MEKQMQQTDLLSKGQALYADIRKAPKVHAYVFILVAGMLGFMWDIIGLLDAWFSQYGISHLEYLLQGNERANSLLFVVILMLVMFFLLKKLISLLFIDVCVPLIVFGFSKFVSRYRG